MILLTKIDPLTGKINVMTLDITRKQLDEYEKGTKLVQDVFPNLEPYEREFIMTGIAPDTWEETFNEDNR